LEAPKFIVDHNVGKLTKWLRMMGYDTIFFNGSNDSHMVAKALAAILVASDEPLLQMRQIVDTLNLDCQFRPFSLCLECNQPIEERSQEQVKDRVPPYVFRTQNQYMECPDCHRIYWKGTHWEAMTRELTRFK